MTDTQERVVELAERKLAQDADATTFDGPLGDPFGRLPAPPLPRGLLPAAIETFAEREAETKGVVFHASAMSALTVCAAAIPDHVKVRVKVHEDGWHEAPRLWTALIGPPSAKKSPVIRGAMAPLKRLEKAAHTRWRDDMEDWERAKKLGHGDQPTQRRFVLNDTTIESAGRILAENPHGLLLERDELAGWFGAMDKYSGAKGANADRAFWLTAWNGGPYNVDRISRTSLRIENLSVSILGGIQPSVIRRIAADTVDDGLLQRLIPVFVDTAGPGADTPDTRNAFRDYNSLVARLAELPARTFTFSSDAQELRRDFADYADGLADLETISPQFAAFAGKLDGLFARLALILHVCDHSNPAERISVEVAKRVERVMRAFIVPHALRFYLDLAGDSGILADARAIGGWILAKRIERLTFGGLTNAVRVCRAKSRDEVLRMLEPLEMLTWLAPDDPAWPRHWKVNPMVHERFADRAIQERDRRERMRDLITGHAGADLV